MIQDEACKSATVFDWHKDNNEDNGHPEATLSTIMLLSKSADGKVPGVQFRILEEFIQDDSFRHTRDYTDVGDVLSFGAALEHASEDVRTLRNTALPRKVSKIAVFWRPGSAGGR